MKCFIFVAIFQILITHISARVSCLDELGYPIDHFYLYKLPKGNSDGLDFMHIKSDAVSFDWQPSQQKIDDVTSIPGRTVAQGYFKSGKKQRVVIAYNDEPPTGQTDGNRGHTKGIVVADAESAFWLIHSVPHYPDIKDTPDLYDFPDSGRNYGQSFMCMTLNVQHIDLVGEQLLYNEPHVYFKHFPDGLKNKYPKLWMASNNSVNKNPPFWNDLTIESEMGIRFRSFAKGRNFKKELYEDWVAPVLGTDLYVETWRRGSGNIASNCTRPTKVFNVAAIEIKSFGTSFPTLNDHSKWSVGVNGSDWICVGDINRAEHQKQRGGGTVCQRHKYVANSYRNSISDFEGCPRDSNN